MNTDSYAAGMLYEAFMRRAFKTLDNSKPGIHSSNLQNLIDKENGEYFVKQLPSAEKQLISVKKYLHKAFDKLLKMKLNEQEKIELSMLKAMIDNYHSSDGILSVIRRGLDSSQRFKDF